MPEGDAWTVVGRPAQADKAEVDAPAKPDAAEEKPDEKEAEKETDKADATPVADETKTETEAGSKRPLEDDAAPDAKRARVDDAEDEPSAPVAAPSASALAAAPAPLKAAGDVFIANGIRAELAASLAADIAASLPFPLVDAEIYEPAEDTSDGETLEQVTERVVGALPRVQAIEAVHGYQAMK